MEKRSLYIYKLDEKGDKVKFPNDTMPAKLGEYTYTAQRMGGAPTISATLNYPLCLDDRWSRNEFVEFQGERYYIRQVPTSSKDNSNVMYKHELVMLSERSVLEDTLFFDVVSDNTDSQYKDRYRSNNTDFSFRGDIMEFAARLTDAMIYSGLCHVDEDGNYIGYHVVIDDGLTSEIEEISFSGKYLNEALTEIHNTFNLYYYFIGKTCHVGYTENVINTPFEYGRDKGLVSISKNNTNSRIVDHVTGTGGSDNIPYYYPNSTPEGNIFFDVSGVDKADIKSVSYFKVEAYNPSFLEMTLWEKKTLYEQAGFLGNDISVKGITSYSDGVTQGLYKVDFGVSDMEKNAIVETAVDVSVEGVMYLHEFGTLSYDGSTIFKDDFDKVIRFEDYPYPTDNDIYHQYTISQESKVYYREKNDNGVNDTEITSWPVLLPKDFYGQIVLVKSVKITRNEKPPYPNPGMAFTAHLQLLGIYYVGIILYRPDELYFFSFGDGEQKGYRESGITFKSIEDVPKDGSVTIKINGKEYVTPSTNLMPSIYRQTKGAERFYNAENNKYILPDNNGFYYFNNTFSYGSPHDAIFNFDKIKPTIKGIRNAEGKLYGEIADIAFDSDDNDLLGDGKSNESFNGIDEYVHSWFYIRLNIFNDLSTTEMKCGFNIFDYALEGESAFIEMTSGNCAACKFEIGVEREIAEGAYVFHNPVQIDEYGDIVKGNFDDKVKKGVWQPEQQNSAKYSIWIAVKKENSTFGVIMPNATNNYRPNIGDTFVLTGIKLPEAYVLAAEKRLDDELIKVMKENNDEKFTFSLNLSRVYLSKHENVAQLLNENARINIIYNEKSYLLYVTSYTCKADANILQEINVELSDTLTIGQNSLQKQIESAKNDILSTAFEKNGDVFARGFKYFLRKDQPDTAKEIISFLKGLVSIGPIKAATAYISDALTALKANITTLTANIADVVEAFYADNLRSRAIAFINNVQGWALTRTANDRYRLEIDELLVRVKAIFNELEIRKLSYAGGNLMLGAAGSTIYRVEHITGADGDRYRCYLIKDDGTSRTRNWWKPGDMAKCQTMNLDGGSVEQTSVLSNSGEPISDGSNLLAATTYANSSNRYYWRLVTATGTETLEDGRDYNWIDLSNEHLVQLMAEDGTVWTCQGYDEVFEGVDTLNPDKWHVSANDAPEAGDEIVQEGNQIDAERQHTIRLSTVGENAPEIAEFCGIGATTVYTDADGDEITVGPYSYVGRRKTSISPRTGDVFCASRFEIRQENGGTVQIPKDRGEWYGGMICGYYDRVSRGGELWLCVSRGGNVITDTDGVIAPDRTCPGVWQLQVAKGADGADGAPGADGKDGKDGKDTYMVKCTPDFAIITQSMEAGGGFDLPKEIQMRVMKGTEDVTDESLTGSNYHRWEFESVTAVANKDGSSVIVNRLTSGYSIKGVEIRQLVGKPKSGRIDFTLRRALKTDAAGEPTEYEFAGGSVSYAVNYPGEYSEVIANGIKTELATGTMTVVDPETGEPKTLKNLLELTKGNDGLNLKVSEIEQDFDSLEDTVDGHTENIYDLGITAQGLISRVSTSEGEISTLKQTAQEISLKVGNMEGGLQDTGIDITGRRIDITADKFTVSNNDGVKNLYANADGDITLRGDITAIRMVSEAKRLYDTANYQGMGGYSTLVPQGTGTSAASPLVYYSTLPIVPLGKTVTLRVVCPLNTGRQFTKLVLRRPPMGTAAGDGSFYMENAKTRLFNADSTDAGFGWSTQADTAYHLFGGVFELVGMNSGYAGMPPYGSNDGMCSETIWMAYPLVLFPATAGGETNAPCYLDTSGEYGEYFDASTMDWGMGVSVYTAEGEIKPEWQ